VAMGTSALALGTQLAPRWRMRPPARLTTLMIPDRESHASCACIHSTICAYVISSRCAYPQALADTAGHKAFSLNTKKMLCVTFATCTWTADTTGLWLIYEYAPVETSVESEVTVTLDFTSRRFNAAGFGDEEQRAFAEVGYLAVSAASFTSLLRLRGFMLHLVLLGVGLLL
jgi:hypothetical protein